MMKLLTPVLPLLALLGCSGKVVKDFTKTCPKFFANPGGTRSPPTVFTGRNYKQICQIRDETYEYATLYDTANRIPVYSAYKYKGYMNCNRSKRWYIEPQKILFLSASLIMKLLSPVLLLLALSGCSSEVVEDFTETCPEFFANPGGALSPPTVFTGDHYKQICQIRENTYEYATLYDTANRIPVYSAYRFEGLMGCQREDKWYIEPQLENINDKRMRPESRVEHQASNQDYVNSGYHKGHLAPVYHARTQSCADATFTLTNAAPQVCTFNKGQWWRTEKAVARILESTCSSNQAYVVTGVVPGYSEPPLNDRVNIPSHFWTAYCCLDNNKRVLASGGFIGENTNAPVSQNINAPVPVRQLEGSLTVLYDNGNFTIFGGACHVNSSTENRPVLFQRCQRMRSEISRRKCTEDCLAITSKRKKSVHAKQKP
ncbi:hypothetical protein NFI96_026638 [Prochilodus magdalenae]|nr:hypothetical protein NFI96_026638 [Prochilodus magdalenae]